MQKKIINPPKKKLTKSHEISYNNPYGKQNLFYWKNVGGRKKWVCMYVLSLSHFENTARQKPFLIPSYQVLSYNAYYSLGTFLLISDTINFLSS